MNLNQTIEELEKQAQQFTEAANTLRALQGGNQGGRATDAATTTTGGGARKGAGKKSARKSGAGSRKKRSNVSPETRARISEALRASHARKKEEAANAS